MRRAWLALLFVTACESRPTVEPKGAPHATEPPASTKLDPKRDILGTRTSKPTVIPFRPTSPMVVNLAHYKALAPTLGGAVVPITRWPKKIAEDAWVVVGVPREGGPVCALINHPPNGFTIQIDQNQNGDLRDEVVHIMVARGTGWVGLAGDRREGPDGEAYVATQRFEFLPDKAGGARLNVFGHSLRTGAFRISGQRVPFGLIGTEGMFSEGFHLVVFDQNGDGELDYKTPRSPELYFVDEAAVTLAGRSFTFEVERYGNTLKLSETKTPRPPRASLAIGTAAPNASGVDVDGGKHSLDQYRGKWVLLDFWGTWCAPCLRELPVLRGLKKNPKSKDIVVIGVANDEPQKLNDFLKKENAPWPNIVESNGEGAFHRAFRVKTWPTHFLIGPDGNIVSDAKDLRELVSARR